MPNYGRKNGVERACSKSRTPLLPSDAVIGEGALSRREKQQMKCDKVARFLVLLVLAAACEQAKKVRVAYKSETPGGTLYKQDGEIWGSCPGALWHDLCEKAIKNGHHIGRSRSRSA